MPVDASLGEPASGNSLSSFCPRRRRRVVCCGEDPFSRSAGELSRDDPENADVDIPLALLDSASPNAKAVLTTKEQRIPTSRLAGELVLTSNNPPATGRDNFENKNSHVRKPTKQVPSFGRNFGRNIWEYSIGIGTYSL